jgi:Tfp pilus assembly protein PilZ
MNVLFQAQGEEHTGQAQKLTTWGTFIACEPPDLPEHIELVLAAEEGSIPVSGEVVRVTPEGFSVAFSGLHPETLARLSRLLNDDQVDAESSQSQDIPEVATNAVDIEGQDWQPPVSEPILHQWRPDTDLVQPPPGEAHQLSWENLPTISPPALEPGPVSPAEQPVEKAAPEAAQITPSAQETDSPEKKELLPPVEDGQLPLEESIAKQVERAEQTSAAGAQAPEPASPQTTTTPAAQLEQTDDPSNRRESERSDQSIPIVFDNLTTLIKEFTHNISFGGLFVYTDRPLKKGDEIAVTLVHPVHGERLTLLSRVAHSGAAPTPDPNSGAARYGIGVQFRIPLDELKRLLSDFISSHQKPKELNETEQMIQQAKVIMNRGARSQHQLLGIATTATKEEIRRAYFELVDCFHPDRYYGKVSEANQKLLDDLFRQLTTAYEALTA